eukprot:862317-Prymnesium_polylepis.1
MCVTTWSRHPLARLARLARPGTSASRTFCVMALWCYAPPEHRCVMALWRYGAATPPCVIALWPPTAGGV